MQQHVWKNVLDHEIMEAKRARICAQLLGLSESIRDDLVEAAARHDFYKREERKISQALHHAMRADALAKNKAIEALRKARTSERIIRFIDAVGGSPDALEEMERLVAEPELSEEDLACLVMHYIDDYTIDSSPVTPATTNENDLDRRIARNRIRYPEFGDEHDEQERVGHRIEQRLSELLAKRGISVEPLKLPEFIDQKISRR